MPRKKETEPKASMIERLAAESAPAEKQAELAAGLHPEKWYELMNERSDLLAKLAAKGEAPPLADGDIKERDAASRIKSRLLKIGKKLQAIEIGPGSEGRIAEFYQAAGVDEKFSAMLGILQKLKQEKDNSAAEEYAIIRESKGFGHELTKADREALLEIREEKRELDGKENALESSAETAQFFRMATLETYRQALQDKSFVETPSRQKLSDRIKFHLENSEPILLEGETGTGKTELALNLCRQLYGQEPEFIAGSPDVRASDLMVKQGLRASETAGQEKREELAREIYEHMEIYKQANPEASEMDVARENDNYARIVAASAGVTPETYFVYGPLVRAMEQGLPLIIDEANLIEPRLRMVMKSIYNAKPGSSVALAGDGHVKVAPGFGLIFTANLKSEKYAERFDFDEAEKRVMINSTIHVDYLPQEELYDLLLAKSMDSQGEAPLSKAEAEIALKNFCDAVTYIQTAYRDKPSEAYAPKDARGKQQEFKEGVLDPGAALRMLNGLEAKDPSESLTAFLDRSILNYASNRNYNPKDRELIAKIFMSKGFLQNADVKQLEITGLAEDALRPFKAQAAKEAKETRSDQPKELNRRQIAELDPYGLRKIANQKIGEEFLDLAGALKGETELSESVGQTSLEQAETILGRENLYGPAAVKKALGIEIRPNEIPPLNFSPAELERAKELNQFLILRVDKSPLGDPLTMKKIMEIKDNQTTDGGKLLYDIDWYKNEKFFANEPLRLSWALVTKELIPGSTGINYLQQTEKLAGYIKSEAFKNQRLPKEYQEALDEFQREKIIIEPLIDSDWQAAASRLEQLKITKLFRRSPAEIIYDLAVVKDGKLSNEMFLPAVYDWSKSRDSDGGFVDAGDFLAGGADVCSGSPDDVSSDLGVCLSRNPFEI